MELVLIRRHKEEDYTIGQLYINDIPFCDTLEDTDRGLTDQMSVKKIQSIKIKHKTAIPTGTYRVSMDTYSPKYKKIMPRLLQVKGFSGILIHSGNTEDDTSGCILVGENLQVGKVLNSKAVFKVLYNILMNCKEEITLTIL